MARLDVKRYRSSEKVPRRGEVWFVNHLEYDHIGGKSRPVIVVDVVGDNVTCMKCTTKIHEGKDPVKIMDLISSGLHSETYVLRNERLTISRKKLKHSMGRLSAHDMEAVFGNQC